MGLLEDLNLTHSTFKHRHKWSRRFVDLVILLLIPVGGIGILIGCDRQVRGLSFFLSNDKTQREKDFNKLVGIAPVRSEPRPLGSGSFG